MNPHKELLWGLWVVTSLAGIGLRSMRQDATTTGTMPRAQTQRVLRTVAGRYFPKS